MTEVCEIIKKFILENNIPEADYVFRVIDFEDNYVDIEPDQDLKIEYDNEKMDFYQGDEKIESIGVEKLNCVFLEDKIRGE